MDTAAAGPKAPSSGARHGGAGDLLPWRGHGPGTTVIALENLFRGGEVTETVVHEVTVS